MAATRPAYLDAHLPIAFAHQGGGHENPENTMAAFDHAAALGFRYIETDVQATADGVVITFHDNTLDRMTDRTGTIAELPWSTVQQATVKGGQPLCLLEDLLTKYPNARVNIEPKHDHAVAPLIDIIRKHDAVDRVCIGSFSGKRVSQMRKALGAALCTSTGPLATLRWVIGSVLPRPLGALVARTSAHCYQVPVKQWFIPVTHARSVALAHHMGKQVHVWTIDDAAEVARLLDLGVDGIMTDRPTIVRDVFVRRGHWPT
jgi:glycerophosphoryl diester phosphodiesterase